ncbi:MAG: hypothetical protein A2Z25_14790 [Planctomycetes bacterium RBG_16_55_9]|nr:MAG: hypothetical protein A2Z25_14790 [Planctomycetes bacterium RBG_16_55_9]
MKSMQQLPTLNDIKSVRSVGATSIPKAKRPIYLELYVLGKERDRLVKELATLNKRRSTVTKNLTLVGEQIKELHKEALKQQEDKKDENSHEKPLKTLAVKY